MKQSTSPHSGAELGRRFAPPPLSAAAHLQDFIKPHRGVVSKPTAPRHPLRSATQARESHA